MLCNCNCNIEDYTVQVHIHNAIITIKYYSNVYSRGVRGRVVRDDDLESLASRQ